MSNRLSVFLKKKILRKNQNLISLEEPYDVLARLMSGRTVRNIVDAGASNGHITRRLLGRFGQSTVYAFEPHPMYTEPLTAFAKEDCRVKPQFVGLADSDGTAELYITESPGNTSMFKPDSRLKEYQPSGAKVKQVKTIRIVRLDDWAKEANVDSIELIKLDVQGAEKNILEGAAGLLEKSVLAVYTEVWFNSAYAGGALLTDIDSVLRPKGFVLYDLYRPKYNKGGVLFWGNAIFIHAGRLGLE